MGDTDCGTDCILRIWLFSRCFLPPRFPRLVLLVLLVIMLASLVTLLSRTVSVYTLLTKESSLLLSLLTMAMGAEGVMDDDLYMMSVDWLDMSPPELLL